MLFPPSVPELIAYSNDADVAPIGGRAKRMLDVALALAGIALLLPLLTLCALSVYLTSEGPIFFRHRRIGFQGRDFDCFKFRTMRPDADRILREHLAQNPNARREWAATRKLRDDPRTTALGRIMRKTSLDELPQLLNVLKGNMSVVGPRPVVRDELAKYASNAERYLACRPGITGFWQVNGRSNTSYRRRIACDRYYAQNWSFVLDCRIILVTIPVLLTAEGAC
jgi:exopolysaccharide production protein ExoY